MEFPFIISKVLIVDQDGYCILESKILPPKTYAYQSTHQRFGPKPINRSSTGDDDKLAEIIDKMGEASSKVAQIMKIKVIEL